MAEREATARRYYEALDSHEYEALRSLLAAEFAHHRPDRTIDGRDRFVRFMRKERPQTETSHPIDIVYTDGDAVAVEGRLLDADGDAILASAVEFSFEGENVVEIRTYTA